MTPKEALHTIYKPIDYEVAILDIDLDVSVEDKVYKVLYKALVELEELKRVVKRYFDMEEKPCELHEVEEFYDLRDKLMKVGKEE